MKPQLLDSGNIWLTQASLKCMIVVNTDESHMQAMVIGLLFIVSNLVYNSAYLFSKSFKCNIQSIKIQHILSFITRDRYQWILASRKKSTHCIYDLGWKVFASWTNSMILNFIYPFRVLQHLSFPGCLSLILANIDMICDCFKMNYSFLNYMSILNFSYLYLHYLPIEVKFSILCSVLILFIDVTVIKSFGIIL